MFQYKNHFMSWLLYLYNFMSPFVVYRNSCDALAGFRKQENCLFPWEYKRKLYPKCFKLVPKISVILRPFILDLKTIRGILPGIENVFEYIGCRWNGISIYRPKYCMSSIVNELLNLSLTLISMKRLVMYAWKCLWKH